MVTPNKNICLNAVTLGETRVPVVDTIGDVLTDGRTIVVQTPSDASITVASDSKSGKPGTGGEEGWVDELTQVSSSRLPPGHPCLEYLKGHGLASGTTGDMSKFMGKPSTLGGRRWYVSVSVHGKDAEFLVDTGASHSIISRKLQLLLSGEHENFKMKVNALTADGSRMKTFGKIFLPLRMGGKEFAFSPTIAEVNDDGIIGLDFAALYNAVLNPSTGVLAIEHPYKLKVQCVLRQISCVASVVQTVKIPAGHTCDVLYSGTGDMRGKMAVMEPDVIMLSSIGLESADTLVANALWSVVPISNTGSKMVYLNRGTEIGKVVLAEAVASSRLELPAVVCKHPALNEEMLKLVQDCDVDDEHDLEKLIKLINEYSDAWATPGEPLGRTDKVQHTIEIGDAEPFKIPYRRLPLAKKKVAEVEIEKMLEENVIVPSTSPWSSPVCMVTKKDGTIRFCIDYRKLNGVTKKNSYPLPRIDETLDSLGGNEWFCTLDLQSGYWQIGMYPNDIEKTAFSSHMGLFQYNVMPFGLCNAPATFEAMMETLLSDLLWKRCLVYLDDIVVFGKTFDECLINLEMVLTRIMSNGLKLKPKKCKLFKQSITFLGRVISAEGIKADPEKLVKVCEYPTPISPKEVRSFLGFCSYYREFLPGYSKVSHPLQILAHWTPGRKKDPFPWGNEQDSAFQAIKDLFVNTPVLRYPTEGDHFILDTDASCDSIGAALSQVQDGVEVPIAFASNTMNKAQRNYCTTKRELLAVMVYTKKFKHFLWGSDFTLRTDHSSLRWLLNFKDAEGMIARWLAHLSEFGLIHSQIEHRAGAKHINADVLSRIPVRKCSNDNCDDCGAHNAVIAGIRMPFDNSVKCMAEWSMETIKKFQEADTIVKYLIQIVPGGVKPIRPGVSIECREMRQFLAGWTELEVRKGILYRWKCNTSGHKRLQVVIPSAMRRDLLYFCHGHQSSGHFGKKRSLERLNRQYYWPGMSKQLLRWVATCPSCCVNKPGVGMGKLPLSQELFGVRFARVAVDIISGFKTTPNDNTCMMVVTDYYTKYTRVFPLKDHKAITCATALVKGWIMHLGVPLMLHSDQGPEFQSELWQCMCECLAICKTRTNPYRPQSDGMVERFNRTLIQVLKPLVNMDLDDWDEQCEFVCHAYNSTVHSCTNCTPNLLVFGEEIIMPADLVYGVVGMNPDLPCHVMFVETLRDKFRSAYEMVRLELEKNANWQKTGYDTGLKKRQFNVGDRVLRYHQPLANIKLAANWDGPFTVTQVISDTTVLIRSDKGKLKKSNVARLRLWLGRELHEVTAESDDVLALKRSEESIVKLVLKRGRGRPRKVVDGLSPNISDKKKVSPSVDLKGHKKKIKTKSDSVKKPYKVRNNKNGEITNLRRSPRLHYLRSAVT